MTKEPKFSAKFFAKGGKSKAEKVGEKICVGHVGQCWFYRVPKQQEMLLPLVSVPSQALTGLGHGRGPINVSAG